MPALTPQPPACFLCLGMSMADALRLGLWSSISDNMACRGALESMTSLGALTLNTYAGLPVLDFDLLTATTGRIQIATSSGLTAVNFPVLASYPASTFSIADSPLLVTLTVPLVTFSNLAIGITLTNNALSAASIEGVLRRGVVSGLTTATLNFSGGTSANLASLSAAGQADAATLTTAGCTLIFNP